VPRCLRAIRKMPVVLVPPLSSKMPQVITGAVEGGQTVVVVGEDASESSSHSWPHGQP
jgi:hypothetical protein